MRQVLAGVTFLFGQGNEGRDNETKVFCKLVAGNTVVAQGSFGGTGTGAFGPVLTGHLGKFTFPPRPGTWTKDFVESDARPAVVIEPEGSDTWDCSFTVFLDFLGDDANHYRYRSQEFGKTLNEHDREALGDLFQLECPIWP